MIHIAFCTDTNYIMPTGVAMISICENNREDEITFHLVITDEGSAQNEVEEKVAPLLDITKQYKKKAEVYRMDAAKISSFVCTGAAHISTTAITRIFLPDLLPLYISRILYLDCDIVCDGGIRDLWNIDLGSSPIGGVIDCNGLLAGFRKKIRTPLNVPYINSGVLLINLDIWRQEGYADKLAACALDHKFSYLDQDTINFYFRDQIKILPIKYNAQTLFLIGGEIQWHVEFQYLDEIKYAMNNPVIIHYLTMNKPWKTAYCPHRDKWEKYLKLSIWKDFKRQPVLTSFDRTEEYQYLINEYWNDGSLFLKGINSYIRFFSAAVKLKHKSLFFSLATFFLNINSFVLEKTYLLKKKGKK